MEERKRERKKKVEECGRDVGGWVEERKRWRRRRKRRRRKLFVFLSVYFSFIQCQSMDTLTIKYTVKKVLHTLCSSSSSPSASALFSAPPPIPHTHTHTHTHHLAATE